MSTSTREPDGCQISHVINKDKKYLSDHGQKLFNAINILLDDQEQLELTQALCKYQREHNVFTLVRCCRELFDTPRKKSLMLFMRPVIPVRDRFHYDEYYKLFFPEEFPADAKSIFAELIPKDLIEKTVTKANEKKKLSAEKEKEKERAEKLEVIKTLETAGVGGLDFDLDKLIAKPDETAAAAAADASDSSSASSSASATPSSSSSATAAKTDEEKSTIKIAGFRILDLAPNENESLGFDVCLGPTGTFIMISYIEPGSLVERLGMKVGDELVSVNETSFKMMDLEQAIEILSTEPNLRIVLQTSGFLPEQLGDKQLASSGAPTAGANDPELGNQWVDPFGRKIGQPSEEKQTLKRHIRRITLKPVLGTPLGFKIRGGIEHALGVFVSFIELGSPADKAGLRLTDQIIEVNGQTLSRVSLEEAAQILRSGVLTYISNGSPIKLIVRYLGKLPVQSSSVGIDGALREPTNRIMLDKAVLIDEKLESQAKVTSVRSEQEFLLCEEMSRLRININNLISQQKGDPTVASAAAGRPSLKDTESLKGLFSGPLDFNMFRYYLNEYQNSRISVQYLVYLVRNYVKAGVQLLAADNLAMFLHNEADLRVLRRFQQRRRDASVLGSLNDYVKNSLIVKSIDFSDIAMINAQTQQPATPAVAAVSAEFFSFEDFKGLEKSSKFKSLDNLKYNIM